MTPDETDWRIKDPINRAYPRRISARKSHHECHAWPLSFRGTKKRVASPCADHREQSTACSQRARCPTRTNDDAGPQALGGGGGGLRSGIKAKQVIQPQ